MILKDFFRSSLAAALAVALAGCGASEPRIVVHAGAPVIVDPTPDKPGFDPRSARLRASAREVERVAGHAIVLHVDAALLSNDPTRYEETLVSAMTSLAKALDAIKGEDEKAFAHGAAKLEEIFARYDPIATEPKARFDAGGKRLVVDLGARPRELVPMGAVLVAMLDAYDDATDAKLSAGPPRTQADIEARFVWLTRTRPGRGSVVVHRRVARATNETRGAASREAESEVRLEVIELEGRATSPELRSRMQSWIVDELPRVEHEKRADKTLLARSSAILRAERVYDTWVERRFWELPEAKSEKLAVVLFPHGEPCHGEEATCAKSRPLSGVARIDIGMKLLAEARAADWDGKRAEHPTLVAKVVCPSSRDALGKPRDTCNASFAAHALATSEGKKKLLDAVTGARDPRFAAEVAASLGYAGPEEIRAYLRGLEGSPALYKEAARALVFGVWDRARGVLEEETRRAWATEKPELRAATVTVLAESRGKLHRHYADGYFERFEKEWGARVDEKTMTAFLDGPLRTFASVPRLWKALEPAARVSPFLAGLDRFLAAPEAALDEPRAVTLEALVARLCDDTATADLDRVHRALDAARRKSPENARAVGNAFDDSGPNRCRKKKDPDADRP